MLSIENRHLEGTLVDISLKGALIQLQPDAVIKAYDAGTLKVKLSEPGKEITVESLVVHVTNGLVGLRCISIDLDSVTDLYRLVEMNLGGYDLLERELSALIDDDSQQ